VLWFIRVYIHCNCKCIPKCYGEENFFVFHSRNNCPDDIIRFAHPLTDLPFVAFPTGMRRKMIIFILYLEQPLYHYNRNNDVINYIISYNVSTYFFRFSIIDSCVIFRTTIYRRFRLNASSITICIHIMMLWYTRREYRIGTRVFGVVRND